MCFSARPYGHTLSASSFDISLTLLPVRVGKTLLYDRSLGIFRFDLLRIARPQTRHVNSFVCFACLYLTKVNTLSRYIDFQIS